MVWIEKGVQKFLLTLGLFIFFTYLSPFIIGLIQLGVEIVLSYILKKVEVLRLILKNRFIVVFFLFGIITFVVSQAVQFYLLNGRFLLVSFT